MKKESPVLLQLPSLLLLLILILTFVPFLGEALFHTKGEPREAVVAMSMLQSGDWILPVSNGGDIPYKPPMLAWVIACLSWLNGGVVTEFLSRFPSALAAVVMIMWGFVVAKRHIGTRAAFMMALVTATSFEVHRAATNCRVDMLLTMFMVCGTYCLYTRYNSRNTLFSWAAILLFSGAVLTKGPVGVLLPLLVMWVYAMLRGGKFLRVTLESAAVFVLSLLLPALWYYAAYQRGGDRFFDLMMEENFGRMMGTMSYESHVNPWYYNIMTVLAGMLPYTLLALFAAIPLWLGRVRGIGFRTRLSEIRENPWKLFMALSSIIIFVFYCIPASKRSVYLLPIYPMLAWYVTEIAAKAMEKAPRAMRVYAGVIGFIGLLLPVIFFIVRYSSFGITGSSAMFLHAVRTTPIGITASVCIALAAVMSFFAFRSAFKKSGFEVWFTVVSATVALYWSFSAFYQPTILNIKSEKPVAQALAAAGYGTEKPIAGWMADRLMRFYVVDFYLDDKVKHVQSPKESDGALLVYRGELPRFSQLFSRRLGYEVLREFRNPSGKSNRDILLIQPISKSKLDKISAAKDSLVSKRKVKIVNDDKGFRIVDRNTGEIVSAPNSVENESKDNKQVGK